VDAALTATLLEARQRLNADAVAVRSSAVAEDLAGASFAGQFRGNVLVDLALDGLERHADRILDGAGRRTSVADDRDPSSGLVHQGHSQKRPASRQEHRDARCW